MTTWSSKNELCARVVPICRSQIFIALFSYSLSLAHSFLLSRETLKHYVGLCYCINEYTLDNIRKLSQFAAISRHVKTIKLRSVEFILKKEKKKFTAQEKISQTQHE